MRVFQCAECGAEYAVVELAAPAGLRQSSLRALIPTPRRRGGISIHSPEAANRFTEVATACPWRVKVVTQSDQVLVVDGFATQRDARAWIMIAVNKPEYHNALFQMEEAKPNAAIQQLRFAIIPARTLLRLAWGKKRPRSGETRQRFDPPMMKSR